VPSGYRWCRAAMKGQRRDAVVAPGLRGPDVVHAQALGLGHIGARLGPVGRARRSEIETRIRRAATPPRAVAIFWSWPA